MTTQKYTIADADLAAAVVYIDNKLRDDYWPSPDTKAQLSATRSFKNARRNPVTLTKWLEKHLDTDQQAMLKNAIRAARKRNLDKFRDKPKSIVLSYQSWRILRDLAEHDDTTLSATIENRLSLAWRKL